MGGIKLILLETTDDDNIGIRYAENGGIEAYDKHTSIAPMPLNPPE